MSIEIKIISDYSIKNFLLFGYIVFLYLIWGFIYFKFTDKLELKKGNLINFINNLVLKFICWVWFIGLFYISQSILFMSSSHTFLLDKVDLIYRFIIVTILLGGILLIINVIRWFNSLTGFSNFLKELWYEMRGGK